MSAILDLVPLVKIADATWAQPLSSVVDVSGYREAALELVLATWTYGGSAMSELRLQTAIDNDEGCWADLGFVARIEAAPGELPVAYHYYYAGPTMNTDNRFPGFARYLRMALTNGAGNSVTFTAKLLLKR